MLSDRWKKWGWFALRWGIAIGGIWWVISNMTFRDQVTILDARRHPVKTPLLLRHTPGAPDPVFTILDPVTGQPAYARATSPRIDPDVREMVNPIAGKPRRVTVTTGDGEKIAPALALDLTTDLKQIKRILVAAGPNGDGIWVLPGQVKGGYRLDVPRPLVDEGIITLIRQAQPAWLWAAILVMPIVFIITAMRWHELLKALDVHITLARTFALTMVGAFYNSFMPGSTGGDLLKAYYAAQQTEHKTRAVLSVVIDRAIGMLGLIILGGAMAGYQYFTAANPEDPAIRACRRVMIGAALICTAMAAAITLFAVPAVRSALGLDWLLSRLPLQKQVQRGIEVMSIYRRRPTVIVGALLATFPVHITVVVSAMLAGKAFGLPIPPAYYFVAVPVIVLAGAIPISPQGAGVMEFFAIQLTKQHGVSVGGAFALTMSIRLVQLVWNLAGGILVLRGGFHAPTAAEQQELERAEDAEDRAAHPPAGPGDVPADPPARAAPLAPPTV